MGFRFAVLGVLLAFGAFAADQPELTRAHKFYDRTNFQGAVEQLLPIAATSPAAAELLGQSWYMLGDYKKATDAFDHALAMDPSRSTYYHWRGRAYGRRAETSFPVMAASYATKARGNFEKAVELDPSNLEAVSDLLEYYLQAPGFMGGGFDKAEKMARLIAAHDPAEGAFASARIAEERKDYRSAETCLKRAIELAPHQVGRMLDLGKLLAKQGRYEESDTVFANAEKIEPGAPKLLFVEASTYIRFNRRKDDARELLTRFLASNTSPDDPSKSEARRLLRQVSGN